MLTNWSYMSATPQRSARTNWPGFLGGAVRDVGLPKGSAVNLPLLGPAAGFLPALRSLRISSASLTVKSS